MNGSRNLMLSAAALAVGLTLAAGPQDALAGACKKIPGASNKQCVVKKDIKKGSLKMNRLHDDVQKSITDMEDHDKGRESFYFTLNLDMATQTIATHGPLKYFARCRINDAGDDRVEIVATSTQGPWYEENASTTERIANEEIVAGDYSNTTGTKAFDNETDDHSMIGPGGYVMGFDGDVVGFGLNLYSNPCTFAGQIFKVTDGNAAP